VEHCSLRAILTLGLTLPLWLDLTLPLSLELGSPITGLPSRSALVAPPLRLAALLGGCGALLREAPPGDCHP
jgi:hypothetical protein